MSSTQDIAKRVALRWAALFEPPPAMVEAIGSWIRSVYAGHVLAKKLAELEYLSKDYAQRQAPGHFIKEELVHLQRLIKELRKYTSNPKVYKSKATKNFSTILSGWHYLNEEEQQRVVERMPKVKVVLLFKARKTLQGQFNGQTLQLEVDMPALPDTVRQFQKTLVELHDTLLHELGHMGQLAMTIAGKPGGGLPSKKLIDTEYGPEGFRRGPALKGQPEQLEYLLHSAEFYPHLLDGIRAFRREVRQLRQDDRADAARTWVGEPVVDHKGPALNAWRQRVPRVLWAPNPLLKKLKDKSPELWEKAVKEFYKAIQPELS